MTIKDIGNRFLKRFLCFLIDAVEEQCRLHGPVARNIGRFSWKTLETDLVFTLDKRLFAEPGGEYQLKKLRSFSRH